MSNPRPKYINVKAKRVEVVQNGSQKQQKKKPRRPRRERVFENSARAQTGGGVLTSNSATMGCKPPPNIRSVREFGKETLSLDTNQLGWFYKYHDPMGATETSRDTGEYAKIPDGLLKHSVDAEMRMLTNLSIPGSTDSQNQIDGRLWSLILLSIPCFRVGYIAVANEENKEMDRGVQRRLVRAINGLVNWRLHVEQDQWENFMDGWYFKVVPFPPTYNFPEP